MKGAGFIRKLDGSIDGEIISHGILKIRNFLPLLRLCRITPFNLLNSWILLGKDSTAKGEWGILFRFISN